MKQQVKDFERDATLGELFDELEQPYLDVFLCAVKRTFGDDRDDQEFKKLEKERLLVPLNCFTDKRFLEILDDFESGKLKKRLLKEFLIIGLKMEEMEMMIMNMEEVKKTREAIIHFGFHLVWRVW